MRKSVGKDPGCWMRLKRWLELLVSFIYPESEAAAALSGLTPAEACSSIPRATDLSGIAVPGIQAIWQYQHPLAKNVIHELKGSKNLHAADCAGFALYTHLNEKRPEADKAERLLLIPIPLSRRRERERGYNQCELIVKASSKYTDAFEVRTDLLEKPIHRAEQKTKSRSERIEGSRNIFRVIDPRNIAGRTCVLVDDVVTTGSTLASARQAILDAGAIEVVAIAIAH